MRLDVFLDVALGEELKLGRRVDLRHQGVMTTITPFTAAYVRAELHTKLDEVIDYLELAASQKQ